MTATCARLGRDINPHKANVNFTPTPIYFRPPFIRSSLTEHLWIFTSSLVTKKARIVAAMTALDHRSLWASNFQLPGEYPTESNEWFW